MNENRIRVLLITDGDRLVLERFFGLLDEMDFHISSVAPQFTQEDALLIRSVFGHAMRKPVALFDCTPSVCGQRAWPKEIAATRLPREFYPIVHPRHYHIVQAL